MKKIINISVASFLLLLAGVGGGVLTSCSDEWDDHYDENRMPSDQTLLELIQADNELSDFLQVLQSAHLYNNNHSTPVTYAELLGADQSLTVWAPKNGTFNRDSIINECLTQKGDSMIGQHFLGNHIAHTLYDANATTKPILMMNNKEVLGSQFNVNPSEYNIPAKNGLLHVVNKQVPYNYNIYEGITSMTEYSHIGDFFKRFETQELDEDASIQRGIENGQKVYSDSVMIKRNVLYNRFGLISQEDSSYFMLMPDKDMWNEVVSEASPYFNFGSVLKADSIRAYWMNSLLLQGLFFNRNTQYHPMDSINSTWYSRAEPEYNVFYHPYDAGGIMTSEYLGDSLYCSNGTIYSLRKWPFTKEQLYLRPVKVEPEYTHTLLDNKECTFNYRQVMADSVSGDGYIDIVPAKSTSNWTAKFELANTLSGTYDVCAIVLPKTVYNKNSRDFKPNKFYGVITYANLDGTDSIQTLPGVEIVKGKETPLEVQNDPYVVDTVVIGRVTLPTCNYQQKNVTVNLELHCSIANREIKFSREMYLDCIYLRPVTEENSAESKKH